MKKAYPILIALLAAPAGAAEQPLSQDQQDACGALLCLAGGGATPECNPYLKRFYDTDPKERRGFLASCPSSGVSQGALDELAAHGAHCESDKLATLLNRQLCSEEQKERGLSCRGENPAAWRMCAHFYAELTDEQPPRQVQRCRNEPDDSGALTRACRSWWVANDYEAGTWCKDKDASCEETDVSSETNRPIAGR